MPKIPVTFELDETVLRAARRQALEENRQLSDYVADLIKRDLNLPLDEGMTIINAAGVPRFVPDREPGETREEYEETKELFARLLNSEGEK